MAQVETTDDRAHLRNLGFTDRQIDHLLFERRCADRGVYVKDGVGPRVEHKEEMTDARP